VVAVQRTSHGTVGVDSEIVADFAVRDRRLRRWVSPAWGDDDAGGACAGSGTVVDGRSRVSAAIATVALEGSGFGSAEVDRRSVMSRRRGASDVGCARERGSWSPSQYGPPFDDDGWRVWG